MTAGATPLDPLHLLAEDGFVRGLARGLLRDAHAAEDVAQDAWLRALDRPPRQARALRGWLRTVVRHLAFDRAVADAARARRERLAARPEQAPSDDDVRARETLRREVVEHVLALPEPYRATVLLRYFEGLTPRAIAARHGLTSAAVRTRLHRALSMLRERLDAARGGDRRAWCLALAPLAGARSAVPAILGSVGGAIAGSLIMNKSVVLGAAAAALLLGAGVWIAVDLGVTRAADGGGSIAIAPADRVPEGETGSASRRAAVGTATAGTEVAADAGALTGRLLHADGQPAAAVPYWFQWWKRAPAREAFPERWHATPADAARTAGDGGWMIARDAVAPRVGEAVLWCEPVAGTRVAFVLAAASDGASSRAASAVLHLPALADLHVTCAGLGATDRWRVLALPAMREEDGDWNFGHHLIRPIPPADARPDAPLVVELDHHDLDRRGPAPAVIRVPAGVPYHVSVEIEAFAMPTEPGIQRAPATIEVAAGAPAFTLPIEVLEADERTPARCAGRVVVGLVAENYAHTQELVDGRAVLGWGVLAAGAEHAVRVLMADGEQFEHRFTPTGSRTPDPIRFVRGRGQPPQVVRLSESRGPLAAATVVVERRDGRLTRIDRDYWGFRDSPGAFVVRDPQEIGLVAVAPDWRRLWVLLPEGDVAQADNANSGPARATWQPSRPAGDVDLAGPLRARGAAWATAAFEIELVTASGGVEWQPAEAIKLLADDDVIPTWRKRVPVDLRHRFRMWMPGLGEEWLTLTPSANGR